MAVKRWNGTAWVIQSGNANAIKYQATAPADPVAGDVWVKSDVDVSSFDSSQFLRWRETAVGGETSLSGNDDNGLPLRYTPGYEQVYINGVLQVRNQDYTATTGTTVTGLTALVANDVVEIFSAVARTVADVYTQTQSDARFVNKNVGGLNLVIPTGATNGTVGANGAVTIGTGVSSVTVQGAFSAAYDNYKILVSGGTSTVDENGFLTLGASNTNYYGNLFYNVPTNSTPLLAADNNTAQFTYAWRTMTTGLDANIEVRVPFLAKPTRINGSWISSAAMGTYNGVHTPTTSYADFTIRPGSGTLTGGTIRIYGYNNGA
jgi:hypothetical protein